MISTGLYMTLYGERIHKEMKESYQEAMMKFYGSQEGVTVQQVKIVELNNKAYWMMDHVLYQADISDGEIQSETKKPFNAIDAPLAQVTKLMEVLDELKDDEE